ncbi:hypothetical protein VTJ04DRAFT_3936 [Mycothermus thermophilus]|uniref:uncharacterized protein n=1 Tax=Humicola insolens TaxID=85995 RepID=UPI0037442CE8
MPPRKKRRCPKRRQKARCPPPPPPPLPQFKYFLALPFEIRCMIYDFALRKPKGVGPIVPFVRKRRGPWRRNHPPGLLQVSRQLAAESTPRFYGMNKFIFSHEASLSLFSFPNALAGMPRPSDTGRGSRYNPMVDGRWEPMLLWFKKIGQNATYITALEYDFGSTSLKMMKDSLRNIAQIQPFVPNLRSLMIRYTPYHSWGSQCCRQLGLPPQVCQPILDLVRGLMLEAGAQDFENVGMVPNLARSRKAKTAIQPEEHNHGVEGYVF